MTNGLDGSISVIGASCGPALESAVRRLSADDFRHRNQQRALLNRFSSLLPQLEENSCSAGNRLLHDILPKTDGYARPRDWVTSASAQQELQGLIQMCLAQLRGAGCDLPQPSTESTGGKSHRASKTKTHGAHHSDDDSDSDSDDRHRGEKKSRH